MKKIPVLAGSLDEQDLGGLLEGLSLMRQLSTVEIKSPLGAFEGALWIKSGQLLEASAGARAGLDALRYLLDRPGTFDVLRVEGSVDGGIRPMMPIDEALEQARALAPTSVSWSTGMQPIGSSASEREPAVTASEPAPPSVATRPSTQRPPAPVASVPAPALEPSTRVSSPAPLPRRPAPSARDRFATGNSGPVLAVFANKGGVGKTTLSINLGVTLARRGLRTILVDTDPRNDVGSALAARRDTSVGLFDVLDGSAELRDVTLDTALGGFAILPAGGVNLSEERFQAASTRADRLTSVLAALSAPGTIVLVDTPPGLRGVTYHVLRASTHSVAVVQAEPIALRAAIHVPRVLDSLPARERPALLGVVLNMLDRRVGASLGVLEEACRIFGADAVLDIAVPRSGVFIEASETGAPVALIDRSGGHAVGWIFESLASALLARAGLETPRFAETPLL